MKVRRVVTEINKDGKSVVKWDSEIESQSGRPNFEQVPLWATDTLPVQLTDEDPITRDLGTSVANGSVFRIARYEPGVAERWHATDTIDYAVVLSGELWMELDEGALQPARFVPPCGQPHNRRLIAATGLV